MRKIVSKGLMLALVLFGLSSAANFAGASERPWIDFDCGDHKLHVRVGGDPSLIDVRKNWDGSIRITGSEGDSVIASCDQGCLKVDGAAACSTTGPDSTNSFDINCPGGHTFAIDGGNNQANCSADLAQDGSVTGGSCNDGNGNSAVVDCSANGGEGTCRSKRGSGECRCVSCRNDQQQP